ncbi:hypothetical protein KIN20_028061 [Parelaphostrongylus tenuis]|uniref:Glutaminase EF-hand domain-containing protein n=1 Tax=Parelaphostrongylus tenuis TaxID=148309 RepID=A0AAD5R0G3_PARTN|nr:hypothetical protein KIN20_028061 [Parelaphostrongylus tenuis]
MTAADGSNSCERIERYSCTSYENLNGMGKSTKFTKKAIRSSDMNCPIEAIGEITDEEESQKSIASTTISKEWIDAGIRRDDPRLREFINKVREAENDVDHGVFNHEHLFLDKDAFKKCVGNSIGVIGKALKKQLVIPDWSSFTNVMGELYEECRRNDRGQNILTWILGRSVYTGNVDPSTVPIRFSRSAVVHGGGLFRAADAREAHSVKANSLPHAADDCR